MLVQKKACIVFGFDLDHIGVQEAKRKGIKARVWDANEKLPYSSKSFDVVICNTVLEFIENPDQLVAELFRVGKKTVIISFPNFGFWAYRVQMLLGIFPNLSLFGHTWWNTRMIKFFSLNDFLQLPALKNKKPTTIIGIDWRNRHVSFLAQFYLNFFSRACIVIFERINSGTK